jgi:MtrB/PioB family decaheme-associated outer membrane protein
MKMRMKVIIFTILLGLISFSPVFSEEKEFGGVIKLTGKLVDVNGNETKFNEYRDLEDGLYSKIKLKYDTENYFLKLKASDIGYDTQYYRLDGGMYGKFKYDLYYNEIPHTYTLDAKTFYSGVGTDNLTGTKNTDLSTWHTFDYEIKRKQMGGGIDIELVRPFYVDLSASREDRDGIKPKAAFTSSTSAFVELPEPVDYKTDTFKAEIGYATRPLFASLSYFYSEFDNANTNLSFVQPNQDAPDKTTLPPDNNYYKVALKGAATLPFNSRLHVSFASSKAKSDAHLFQDFLVVGQATRSPITYADGVTRFEGKVRTQDYAFVLTSNPVPFLDGKVFYKYYDKDNKSDEIVITSAGDLENELFDYNKSEAGVDLGFKLPYHLHLNTTYGHQKVSREREDIPVTKDNIYGAELRWNGLDFMTARIGFERLEREADHEFDLATATEFAEKYIRRFDAWNKERDSYKAFVEFYPIDNLSLSLGYKNSRTNYEEAPLGRQSERRDEIMVDADYAIGTIARLGAYWEYEKYRINQFMRNGTNNINDVNPANDPTDTNFNWDATILDRSFNYGANADVYVIPEKLKVRVQYDHLMSDGNADLTYFNLGTPADAATATTGRTNSNMDSEEWDDYKKTSFMIKAVYDVMKNLSVSAGYAYERYQYNDDALDNYPSSYTSGPTVVGTTTTYLTGLYKDLSYNANVVFVGATYKF